MIMIMIMKQNQKKQEEGKALEIVRWGEAMCSS